MGDVVSILPQLEPVCGIGFAVGLAYLNLERFRYRNKIRQKADGYMQGLTKNAASFQKLKEINPTSLLLISYLSGLQDHDIVGHKNGKNNSKPPEKSGSACWIYNKLYRKHRDRKICITTCAVSFVMLLLGVLSSTNLVSAVDYVFNIAFVAWLSVVVLSLCVITPLAFVKLGNWIVEKLSEDADKAFDEIARILKVAIPEEATIKDK